MEFIVWLSSLGDLKLFCKAITIILSILDIVLIIMYLNYIDEEDRNKLGKITITLIVSFLMTVIFGMMWGLIPNKPIDINTLKVKVESNKPESKEVVDTVKPLTK